MLAGLPMTSTLDGDDSLRRRPVARIIEPLRSMGAELHARLNDSLPPVTVIGRTPLRAIDVTTPVPSAQVKSAILLAGLRADGRTTVRESVATRDHTERMLRARGVPVERTDMADGAVAWTVEGGLSVHAVTERVPGDVSAAAFWLVAGAIHPDAELRPPRRRRQSDAPRGDRHPAVDGRRHRGAAGRRRPPMTASASRSPIWWSAPPTFAPSTSGRPTWPRRSTRSPSCASPRPPPTARPSSVARASSATRSPTGSPAPPPACGRWAPRIEVDGDDLRITGGGILDGAETDSLDDHRLAMTFAIAGLVARGVTTIGRPGSAAISYPGFFDDLERVRA